MTAHTPFESGMAPSRRDFDCALCAALAQEALVVALLRGDRIVGANPGFEAWYGPLPESANVAMSDLAIVPDRSRVSNSLEEAFRKMESRLQLAFHTRDVNGLGRHVELLWFRAGTADDTPALAFLFETRTLRRNSDECVFLAFLDPLTGLPNRAQFIDHLCGLFTEAYGFEKRFALMLAEVGGFTAVYSTFGHRVGKLVVKEVGQRLAACVRENDSAAHQNGDEFAVLLQDINDCEDAVRIAERIIEQVSALIQVGGEELRLTVSIGIALYPDHAADLVSLFSVADAALKASKRAGKNRCLLAKGARELKPVPVEFVTWSDAYASGIRMLDEQHRELFDRVNQLGDELLSGHSSDQRNAALGNLVEAARHHFRTEERLMLMSRMDDQEGHAEQHKMLLADLKRLGSDLDRPSVALTMRYLEEWLLRHINGADKHVAVLLRAAGVT